MNDFQGQHFPGKMYYFWKPILVRIVKLAAKSTIIQARTHVMKMMSI